MTIEGKEIRIEPFLLALFALVLVPIPPISNAYAENTTISTNSIFESLVVNEGDILVIEPGVEVEVSSITNNGTITNRGSIVSSETINGGIIENFGLFYSQSKTSNDGGTIENHGTLRFSGERENFYNKNGGIINIKENARFEFSRQGSYEPHSLYNDASSLVDNSGTVAQIGYSGMTIQNQGSLYKQCGATYTIPIFGNPIVDKCTPAPPSEDGKIVFVSDRDGNDEIYVMNPDGSGQSRLTDNNDAESNPKWSPDGTEIVFYSDRDGNLEIYKMNSDGTGQTRLTNNPASDYAPTWSPDGEKIAFSSLRDGNDEIYVMNSDGSDQSRLTNSTGADSMGEWSPDGTRLVFVTQTPTGVVTPFSTINVMNEDGSDLRAIGGSYFAHGHCWSPDSKKIAASLTAVRNPSGLDIHLLNADGSGSMQLTGEQVGDPFNVADSSPCWSPDGSRIAYVQEADGAGDIYIINAADGSGKMSLTDTADDDTQPIWSPDSTKIAFTRGNLSNLDIYIINAADGSGLTRLTTTDDSLDWQADWGAQTPLPENSDPDAVDDIITTDQDTDVNVNVCANDSDPDGDELSITFVTDPPNGFVENHGVCDLVYAPDTGFTGTDTYQYTLSDGEGGIDTAIVTIIVNDVNPPPTDELFCGRTIDDFDNVIDGDSGENLLKGTAEDDLVRGFAGDDTIFGKGGNDCLKGYEGDDRIWGGDGDDFIFGLDDNDKLVGDAGSDTIFGNAGDDNMWGNGGDDMLVGEAGRDMVHGDSGQDRLYGSDGGDYLWGGPDNDIIVGDAGDDKLVGDDGGDHMWGSDGDDFLIGSAGSDKLVGDPGNDRLYGNTGDDSIYDDLGDDSLNGGDDADNCFDAAGTNNIFNCEKQLNDDNHFSGNILVQVDEGPYEENDEVVIEGIIDNVLQNVDSVDITIEDSDNDIVDNGTIELGSSGNFDMVFELSPSGPDGIYTVEAEYNSESAFTYFIVDNDIDSIIVVLDDNNYEAGDSIEITGRLDDVVSGETEVEISVLDPTNDFIIDQDAAELGEGDLDDDEFEYVFDLDDNAVHGRYAVIVSYDNEDQRGFALFEVDDGGTTVGNGDSGTVGDITAEIGEASYEPGDTILLAGTIDNYDSSNQLAILVENSSSDEIESDNDVSVESDGDFEFLFDLGNDADEGQYDVTLTYDTDELVLTFDVEGP